MDGGIGFNSDGEVQRPFWGLGMCNLVLFSVKNFLVDGGLTLDGKRWQKFS